MSGIIIFSLIGAVGLLGVLGYFAVSERRKLHYNTISVLLKNLPREFEGFKIILFSDLHFGFFCKLKDVSALVKEINFLSPDMICFAGDLTDKRSCQNGLEDVSQVLRELSAPYGKYAVLGNHDYHTGVSRVVGALEMGDFKVLLNSSSIIAKDNCRICISGLESAMKGKADIEKTLVDIQGDMLKIILVHEPDYAEVTGQHRVDLQLSGHSHGGQVCLPIVGPLRKTRLGKKYIQGLYSLGKLQLVITKGVGTTILPMRFMCQAEIVVITLSKRCPS
ncbi:MAG: metallophosphoesterase [Peptococcaceae bacterium]|nr:metallophosphoesterase [Peptococcaceae bacterium]